MRLISFRVLVVALVATVTWALWRRARRDRLAEAQVAERLAQQFKTVTPAPEPPVTPEVSVSPVPDLPEPPTPQRSAPGGPALAATGTPPSAEPDHQDETLATGLAVQQADEADEATAGPEHTAASSQVPPTGADSAGPPAAEANTSAPDDGQASSPDITAADIGHLVDGEYDNMELGELAKAPVSALRGVSASDAAVLRKALGVKTVQDLAQNKYVRIAQAITRLSD